MPDSRQLLSEEPSPRLSSPCSSSLMCGDSPGPGMEGLNWLLVEAQPLSHGISCTLSCRKPPRLQDFRCLAVLGRGHFGKVVD